MRVKKPTASSLRVAIAGATSSSAISSLPVQRAFFPDVDQADDERGGEHQHLDVAEPAERAKVDRPGVEEDRLDVEDDEEQGDHVELHREALAGVAHRLAAALEVLALDRAGAP